MGAAASNEVCGDGVPMICNEVFRMTDRNDAAHDLQWGLLGSWTVRSPCTCPARF